jgi:hypothetical protein
MNDPTKKELLLNEISQLGNALQYVNTFYNNVVNLLNESDISDDDNMESSNEEDEFELTEDELLGLKENGVISGFVGNLSYLNK